MKIVRAAAQFVLMVLGLFSGYLRAIAPVSDQTLRIIPGGIAAFAALLLLLLTKLIGQWIKTANRQAYWRISATIGALLAIMLLFIYGNAFRGGTIEVPGGDLRLERRVKGNEYTEKANKYRNLHPEIHDDRTLIKDLGGIDQLWTAASIENQTRRLTNWYVACVAGTILALSLLTEALTTQGTPNSPIGPSPARGGSALKLWREKLEFLQAQEAIVADAAQRFALGKQIEEAREKIRELGG